MNGKEITGIIKTEAVKSCYLLPTDLKRKIKEVSEKSLGNEKKVFLKIIENIDIAEKNCIPLCQDTGIFELWMEIGKDFPLAGINIEQLAQTAVKKAHTEGGLRESMIGGIKPVVHISFTGGASLKGLVMPRGFGSENYTFLHMMNPESTFEDIKEAVVKDARQAMGRPCPPYIIGVGTGGTASKAVELSALALSEINFNPDGEEKEIIKSINSIGTGAGGVGGKYTALGVKIKEFPRHIAGLAVAVHIGCWCNRYRRFSIGLH